MCRYPQLFILPIAREMEKWDNRAISQTVATVNQKHAKQWVEMWKK
jgi:hypothetical protein